MLIRLHPTLDRLEMQKKKGFSYFDVVSSNAEWDFHTGSLQHASNWFKSVEMCVNPLVH